MKILCQKSRENEFRLNAQCLDLEAHKNLHSSFVSHCPTKRNEFSVLTDIFVSTIAIITNVRKLLDARLDYYEYLKLDIRSLVFVQIPDTPESRKEDTVGNLL